MKRYGKFALFLVTFGWAKYGYADPPVVSFHGEAIGMTGIPQNPEDLVADVILEIRGAENIVHGEFKIDLGPIEVEDILPRTPEFSVTIQSVGKQVLFAIDRAIPSPGQDVREFEFAAKMFSGPLSKGFGEFQFLEASMQASDGTVVEPETIPSSWFVFSDVNACIPIRLVIAGSGIPIEGARVEIAGLKGGKGITSHNRSDRNGETCLDYPPLFGTLIEASEDGFIQTYTPVAFIRVESTPQSSVSFPPFETEIPLTIHYPDRFRFEATQLQIPMQTTSHVSNCELYD